MAVTVKGVANAAKFIFLAQKRWNLFSTQKRKCKQLKVGPGVDFNDAVGGPFNSQPT